MRYSIYILATILGVFGYLAPIVVLAAYGADYDWSGEVSVSSAGVVTLPSAMLGEGIFSITGWPAITISGSPCFTKTNSFATPFSVALCTESGTHLFNVDTTNTGTYPSGHLGFFYIYRTESGVYSTDPYSDTNSRIVSVTSPTQFQQTPSDTVDFEYQYFSGSPLVILTGGELTDINGGENIYFGEQAITTTGLVTVSRTMLLTSGHQYTFKPYVTSTAGTRIYGETVTFFAQTNEWQNLVPTTTAGYEALASSTEDIGKTATVGGLLMQRPPFLWFKQINDAYASSTQVTAEAMPTLTVNMSSTSIPFTVDMFSSSTLSTFIPQETHDRLYGIMQASIYAFTLYALYRRVQGAFNKDENEI